MLKTAAVLITISIVLISCTSSTQNSNSNTVVNREVKLDPANMPPGLSATPLPSSATLPPGISLNAVNIPVGNKPIPGIPSAEQLKQGWKPGKAQTPGIPDEANIRKQMGLPITNINVPKK